MGIRTDRRIGRVKGQDEIRDCPEPLTDPKHGAGPSPFAHRGGLAGLRLTDNTPAAPAILDGRPQHADVRKAQMEVVIVLQRRPPR